MFMQQQFPWMLFPLNAASQFHIDTYLFRFFFAAAMVLYNASEEKNLHVNMKNDNLLKTENV